MLDDFIKESDYGSDFTADEEAILTQLLQRPLKFQSRSGLGTPSGDLENNENIIGATILPRPSPEPRVTNPSTAWKVVTKTTRTSVSLEGYNSTFAALKARTDGLEREREDSPDIPSGNDRKEEVPDRRSPLERFRTKPRKPLSVTDLVSPSWCELQYWYSLTKHGKKRRTPAMRQGSVVHKTLEDQVHRTVPIDVQTKEDGWGLRIWNVIQGLRTLRETGMTRELEVWGILDGLVINGIIDEVSYICPDRQLEEAARPGLDKDAPPADQSTIGSFFPPAFAPSQSPPVLQDLQSRVQKTSRIYLTDVKTRGVSTMPRGAALRPTLMQMMLYYRLVSDLATNQIDSAVIFDRYGLDSAKTFSDAFIAQVGNLNATSDEAIFYPSPGQDPSLSQIRSQDTVELLLDHNCLHQLWACMIQEFQKTVVNGAASIGKVLQVEYRARGDGSIMGHKTFLYDDEVIRPYLDDEMRWWRGEREVQGVCEEEAYKCGSCEFAAECTWRQEKIEEATQRSRNRKKSVV